MKFRRYNVIDKVFPERRKFKGSVKDITEIFTFTFYIKQFLKRTENKKKNKFKKRFIVQLIYFSPRDVF